MKIVNVSLYPKTERKQEFIDLMKTMIEEGKNEVGCIQYDIGKDLFNENKYLLVEHWLTADDHANHLKTPHFVHFADTIDDLIADKKELAIVIDE